METLINDALQHLLLINNAQLRENNSNNTKIASSI